MDCYCLAGDRFDPKCAFILGRKAYDIGVRVVTWNQKQGYDGYKRPLRIKPRVNGVDDIDQLLIHHSGQDRRDPATMYNVLWDRKKLSVHFALDEFAHPADGLEAGPIIWQFVDGDWIARHAGKMNKSSIGIEVCHYPSAWKDKNYYSDERNIRKNNVPHEIIEQPVYSKTRKVYAFTEQQVDALARLYAGCWVAIGHQRLHGFTGLFDYPPVFPRVDNRIPWESIPNPTAHTGLILHRHCTSRKWDPAGLNPKQLEDLVEYYYSSFRRAIPKR